MQLLSCIEKCMIATLSVGLIGIYESKIRLLDSDSLTICDLQLTSSWLKTGINYPTPELPMGVCLLTESLKCM